MPQHAMPQIEWLPESLGDIECLHSFLQSKDAKGARRAVKVILDGADLLKNSPGLGRPMPDETGRRELFLPFAAGAYVLRYIRKSSDVIVIIRIWHSREYRE